MREPIQAQTRKKTVRKLSNSRHIWGWPGIDSRPSPYMLRPNASMRHADLLIETECCNLTQVRSKNDGAMAQLVAHLHGMERVRSSNLLSSTTNPAMPGFCFRLLNYHIPHIPPQRKPKYAAMSSRSVVVIHDERNIMAQLTEDMKEFIKNNLAWVATVNQDGIPDLGPKMSMFVLDDNHLAYHERTAGQTYRNLENGSPLVVAFVNFEQKKGYRFRGEVVLHTDDAIYDEQVKLANERGTKVPACVPVLEISEIDDLSAGAKAGTVISHD